MKLRKKWIIILMVIVLILQQFVSIDYVTTLFYANAAPLDAAATSSSTISVDLAWEAFPGATDYVIDRDGIIIASIDANAVTSLSYSDTSVVEDATYNYSIMAYENGTALVETKKLTVSTFDDYIEPSTPENLSVSVSSGSSIEASWDPVVYNEYDDTIHMDWAVSKQNLAYNKDYTKSEEPGSYTDFNNAESTDGTLAGDYSDGYSYGYHVDLNMTKSIDIIIDLEASTSFNNVKIHKWEGALNYGADSFEIYVSDDNINYQLIDSTFQSDDIWNNFSFSTLDARYVKVKFIKCNYNSVSDWLFIDEIQIFKNPINSITNTTNLAMGKTYIKSESPTYPDTDDKESTDGILAKDYGDGNSYGYDIPKYTEKNVDVILDLESNTAINNVKIHKWEGSNYYQADTIHVSVSQDGINFKDIGIVNNDFDSKWLDLSFSTVKARYVKVNFVKYNDDTYGYDWLFIDEIQIFRYSNIYKEATINYELEEDGAVIATGTNTTYANNMQTNGEHTYRVRSIINGVAGAWSTPVNIHIDNTEPSTTPEPTIPVTTPEPTVPISIPEPTIPVTTPEPTVPISIPEPTIPVTKPEPTVPVSIPEPIKPISTPEPTLPISTPYPTIPVSTPEPTLPAATPEPTLEIKPEPSIPKSYPDLLELIIPKPNLSLPSSELPDISSNNANIDRTEEDVQEQKENKGDKNKELENSKPASDIVESIDEDIQDTETRVNDNADEELDEIESNKTESNQTESMEDNLNDSEINNTSNNAEHSKENSNDSNQDGSINLDKNERDNIAIYISMIIIISVSIIIILLMKRKKKQK